MQCQHQVPRGQFLCIRTVELIAKSPLDYVLIYEQAWAYKISGNTPETTASKGPTSWKDNEPERKANKEAHMLRV